MKHRETITKYVYAASETRWRLHDHPQTIGKEEERQESARYHDHASESEVAARPSRHRSIELDPAPPRTMHAVAPYVIYRVLPPPPASPLPPPTGGAYTRNAHRRNIPQQPTFDRTHHTVSENTSESQHNYNNNNNNNTNTNTNTNTTGIPTPRGAGRNKGVWGAEPRWTTSWAARIPRCRGSKGQWGEGKGERAVRMDVICDLGKTS